jgi:hypothetical protein
LKSELRVLYSSEEFKDKLHQCLTFFFLEKITWKTLFRKLSQFYVVLTSPVVTVGSEKHFCTLKRVKMCLRNTMGQGTLNAVSAFSIERDYISTIADFNNKVIQKFAQQKNKRAKFIFR